MATITDKISKIESKLGKIPCLKDKECILHQEIIENLKVIEAIMNGIKIEFIDHRKALVIILEEHGIPCDDVFGWDLNNYRENKKNVRNKRTQRNRHKNTDADVGKGSVTKREERKRKKFIRKRKREERKKKGKKKNENKIRR